MERYPLTRYQKNYPNKDIYIIPNPAKDHITIEISEKSDLEISNIHGQIIKRIESLTGNADIDISGFASGVYIIRALTNKGIITKKFSFFCEII